MNVLAALTDDLLARHFGPQTLARARGYVERLLGQPSVEDLSTETVTAKAAVHGTDPLPYQVELHADLGRPGGTPAGHGWVSSVCSCPVGSMCKHGAALALALRQSFVPAQPAWQRHLDALTRELSAVSRDAASRSGEQQPMALQLSMSPPSRYHHANQPTIHLRPMRRGARNTWVRASAGWSELDRLIASGRVPPEQVEPLEALYLGMRAYGSSSTAKGPPLQAFGARLPRQLAAARDAGIELITAGALRSVSVREEPLVLAADAVVAETRTRFRLTLAIDDELWDGDHVILLGGARPTTAVLLDDGHLLVAPLAAPLPATAERLLLAGPVDVPASDSEAFHDRLAGLVQHVAVRSHDGSVQIPEPLRPSLELTVTWHSSTAADLRWAWSYGAVGRCALGDVDDLGGVRARGVEEEILASVPAGIRGHAAVTGGDALTLAVHDLPYLRGLDDVTVTEEQRPDFREATDAPEVSFEVLELEEDPGYTDWLDLAVTVRVGGEAVPLAQVLAALTLGEEFLVLPSGLYLPTAVPELQKLREVVEAASELRDRDGDRISVGTHDLGVWADLAEAGVISEQAAAWVERARALRDLTELPRPEPVGLTCELRPYQLEGFWWLAFLHQHGLGGILADDMGLGKTLQVLALVQHAREHGTGSPFLVVAPTSVVTAWETEASRHAPHLRVGVVRRRTDDVAQIAAESDLVVTTYTLLRLEKDAFTDRPWAGLVLDEAQQVKNHLSKTYAAARAVEADFRLAVTGTPFENRLMELWALLSLTVPGLYPWPKQFADRVVRPVERDGDEAALDRFRRRIRPFMLRRTKELVADDLPPKQEQVLEVTLTPRHRRLYDAWLAKERQRILGLVADFDKNRVAIFSALTKLRQLALDPALVGEEDTGGSAKLDVLLEHLREVTAEGHRALVFSQFTSYLARVREALEEHGIDATYLDGSTRDRGAVIEEFRTGSAPVFLISLKAGGSGLTLTEADYVFVLDPWWNPAAEAQAVDRAHRIGQERKVHVYRLVAAETIEQKVMQLKARKAELFGQVIDSGGASSTSIDAADIRALFD
ncbi:SNF2-related protein [Georgenia alba]|uniref:SNF2-related protein n=1 Tax=Georgenia alba TaxID=2233858 RepID=A0ABW2Q8K6_9MICO